MFNSIRKDKNRRNLVKKFEIQRLQNKALFRAISVLENKVPLNNTLMAVASAATSKDSLNAKALKKTKAFAIANLPKTTTFSQSKDVSRMSLPLVTSEFSAFAKKPDESSLHAVKISDFKDTLKGAAIVKFFWQEKALKFTPRNSSKNRVRNRCVESGRPRAVLRFCRLSRICLRDKASKGIISGVNKASW